jgi:hypothetical protein
MKKALLLLAIPAAALIAASILYGPQKAEAQCGTRVEKQSHYDALWSWLQRTHYTNWNGASGTPSGFEEGQSPHGALIKTYISPQAATNLKDLPNGSVVVKENYSPDKKLMAITVMHRSKGYDSEHGDWYYAKYLPDGNIAKTPPEMKSIPIAGKFNMCIDCHSGAGGNDFAFFND